MEDTNYVRDNRVQNSAESVPNAADNGKERVSPTETETIQTVSGATGEKKAPDLSTEERDVGELVYNVTKKKTYLQKLSLLGRKPAQNNMLRRVWHSLYYLSWPVIFYAGYGFPDAN